MNINEEIGVRFYVDFFFSSSLLLRDYFLSLSPSHSPSLPFFFVIFFSLILFDSGLQCSTFTHLRRFYMRTSLIRHTEPNSASTVKSNLGLGLGIGIFRLAPKRFISFLLFFFLSHSHSFAFSPSLTLSLFFSLSPAHSLPHTLHCLPKEKRYTRYSARRRRIRRTRRVFVTFWGSWGGKGSKGVSITANTV